jgi:PCRF domain
MLDKLKILAETFIYLEEQLCDSTVIEDLDKFKQISKEHKDLIPIMEAYKTYASHLDRREQAKEMLTVADMREMAEEELNEIEPKITVLEVEINILLTPKDTEYQEDEKDALSDIRFGKDVCFKEQRTVAEENGRVFTLDLPKGEKCCKIHVDGCLITDNNQQRCDYWFHHYDKNDNVFVELKGMDIEHAVEQIIATIGWLETRMDLPKEKRNGAIVLSKNPLTSTKTQVLKTDFRKKYGNRLEIKNVQIVFKFQ